MLLADLQTSPSTVGVFKKYADFLLMYIGFVNEFDTNVTHTYKQIKKNEKFVALCESKRKVGVDLMAQFAYKER